MTFITTAPAKINLDLRIIDTREDGYHELVTVFQSVAVADQLTLEAAAGPFVLECVTPGVPTDPTNLAWKGAAAVAAATGRSLDGWRLRLDKRVPSQAGLGGGSADAVAAARLCLAAWGESQDDDLLTQVLAPLGADVAYFVQGGTARGRGRGDRLDELPDAPPAAVVLIQPDFGVSTAEAYHWFDLDRLEATGASGSGQPATAPSQAFLPAMPPPVDPPRATAEWRSAAWSTCRNDLQPPVAARHPAIDEAVEHLRAAGAWLALMSGSGSSMFGLFPDEEAARHAARGHQRAWPEGWRTDVTTTLSRAGYRAATAVRPS